ncbi:deoxynucleotide monophosphate kinase family protein [Streptomyces sp. NPDC005166]
MAYYKNVGLIGRAQVGKDTVAERLGQRYGYQRVAFADQLKAAALRTDPLIPTSQGVHVRLSRLVAEVGWDYAKVRCPEVRRVLQNLGQSVRDLDPNFWVRAAYPAIQASAALSLPVVVTDVRYENEARALEARGFTLIRVTRPIPALAGDSGKHKSETELADWPVSLTINNSGGLDELSNIVDSLLLR